MNIFIISLLSSLSGISSNSFSYGNSNYHSISKFLEESCFLCFSCFMNFDLRQVHFGLSNRLLFFFNHHCFSVDMLILLRGPRLQWYWGIFFSLLDLCSVYEFQLPECRLILSIVSQAPRCLHSPLQTRSQVSLWWSLSDPSWSWDLGHLL